MHVVSSPQAPIDLQQNLAPVMLTACDGVLQALPWGVFEDRAATWADVPEECTKSVLRCGRHQDSLLADTCDVFYWDSQLGAANYNLNDVRLNPNLIINTIPMGYFMRGLEFSDLPFFAWARRTGIFSQEELANYARAAEERSYNDVFGGRSFHGTIYHLDQHIEQTRQAAIDMMEGDEDDNARVLEDNRRLLEERMN